MDFKFLLAFCHFPEEVRSVLVPVLDFLRTESRGSERMKMNSRVYGTVCAITKKSVLLPDRRKLPPICYIVCEVVRFTLCKYCIPIIVLKNI